MTPFVSLTSHTYLYVCTQCFVTISVSVEALGILCFSQMLHSLFSMHFFLVHCWLAYKNNNTIYLVLATLHNVWQGIPHELHVTLLHRHLTRMLSDSQLNWLNALWRMWLPPNHRDLKKQNRNHESIEIKCQKIASILAANVVGLFSNCTRIKWFGLHTIVDSNECIFKVTLIS